MKLNVNATQQPISIDSVTGLDWTADGQKVVFDSAGQNPSVGDLDFGRDVFLADLSSGSVLVHVVSLGPNGSEVLGSAESPSISNDGRYVSIVSSGTEFVPWDQGLNTPDAVILDRFTQRNAIVSVSTSGKQLVGGILGPSLSNDGRYVVFELFGDELVPGASGYHVFRRDRIGFTPLGYGKPGSGHSIPSLSGSGSTAPGGSGVIQLTGAKPFAPSVLFLALDRTYLNPSNGPFFGTVLATATPFAVLPFTTDGFGLITLPYTLPVGVPLVPEMYMQSAIADPLALNGVSVSSALLMGM